MARTIQQVKAQMIAQKNALTELSSLDSPSQTAFWNLYLFIVAAAIVTFETILDWYTQTWDALTSASYPGSSQWIAKQVFKFQYSATTPQYVQYNATNNTIEYPVVNTDLQIVTRCGVETMVNKTVLVKAAKSEPPEPLTTPEKTSLLSYLYTKGFAGITYTVVSEEPDKLSIIGTVLYKGQFSATIEADVIAALDSWMATVSQSNFNQSFTVNDVIDVIQGVAGVVDFIPDEIAARRDAVAYVSRTKVYNLADGVNLAQYKPYAGYIVQEDSTGYDFASTLTFTASDVI